MAKLWKKLLNIMKWIINFLTLSIFVLVNSPYLKSQEIVLNDSTVLVYPAKINQSDSIFSAIPINAEDLTFTLSENYLYEQLPYNLIMIVEVKTYAFTYYHLEFAKGKGLSKRKSVIMNYKGIIIKEQEHLVYTF